MKVIVMVLTDMSTAFLIGNLNKEEIAFIERVIRPIELFKYK